MKKVLLLSFLIISMPITTFAHTGKDAYQSLKKIQAEIDAGVNYKTYSDRIVDAIIINNRFLLAGKMILGAHLPATGYSDPVKKFFFCVFSRFFRLFSGFFWAQYHTKMGLHRTQV